MNKPRNIYSYDGAEKINKFQHTLYLKNHLCKCLQILATFFFTCTDLHCAQFEFLVMVYNFPRHFQDLILFAKIQGLFPDFPGCANPVVL